MESKGDDTAIIWEGDDPNRDLTITYRQLHERVCKFANSLKALGAKRGDRITLYMPMIPEAAVAMLACARIGAVHSVVFGGFSPDALAGRIIDCESNILVTADQGLRGGKVVPLKANVDAAAANPDVTTLEKVLVVRNTGGDIDWVEGRDAWLHDLENEVDADCPCEEMGAEDPLFILYTSGSTGQPKGVLHTTAGYLLEGVTEGNLIITDSWPGQMRTVYGDHQRFIDTYFSAFEGAYFTGDGVRRDEDGYYWITGRVDDVLNVSGHRMGTAEVESALVAHPSVAEAAVVDDLIENRQNLS